MTGEQRRTTRAVVRLWRADDGWGVLDSAATPGGCLVHFSVVEMPGYRTLENGQSVLVDWEAADTDGFAYRASRVVVPGVAAEAPGTARGGSGDAEHVDDPVLRATTPNEPPGLRTICESMTQTPLP